MDDDSATIFESHRPYLLALAYRVLGSASAAEDILQEAFLRFARARAEVEQPRPYLSKVVVRLALDELKSAKRKREVYVGPWLPEPVVDGAAYQAPSASELATDISVALLLALERLTPAERAAFLLHEVFDVDYSEVSQMLGRSEANCRKLVERARSHVRVNKPRHRPSPEEESQILQAFQRAVLNHDLSGLTRVLAPDAVLYSDGGGRVRAARKPVVGGERVAKFIAGIARKFPLAQNVRLIFTRINGLPGCLFVGPDGIDQSQAYEIDEGTITAIYAVRNPDKLRHLAVPDLAVPDLVGPHPSEAYAEGSVQALRQHLPEDPLHHDEAAGRGGKTSL